MRSFRLDFEVNAFIYQDALAQKVAEDFMSDLKQCTIANQKYFEKQSKWKKFKQRFSRLFAPIL